MNNVAYLKGELTSDTVKVLKEELDEQIRSQKPSTFILDFSDVTFIDNYGIGLILNCYSLVAAFSGILKLQNVSEPIKKGIKASGIGMFVVVEWFVGVSESADEEDSNRTQVLCENDFCKNKKSWHILNNIEQIDVNK